MRLCESCVEELRSWVYNAICSTIIGPICLGYVSRSHNRENVRLTFWSVDGAISSSVKSLLLHYNFDKWFFCTFFIATDAEFLLWTYLIFDLELSRPQIPGLLSGPSFDCTSQPRQILYLNQNITFQFNIELCMNRPLYKGLFLIQDILYFKVYLMSCPAVLLSFPALP